MKKTYEKHRRSTAVQKGFTLVVILLAVVSNHAVHAKPRCKYNEFIIEDIYGNMSCALCPKCPIGQGLKPQCGSTINYGSRFRCERCEAGITYSITDDISSCKPCGICTDHMSKISKCTPTQNSKCGKNCDRRFYYSDETFDCQECSWCCKESESSPIKACQAHGMPFYKQCSANDGLFCQPKCTNMQFVFVDKSLNRTCVDCPKCPPGQGLSPSCSSVITRKNEPRCMSCIPGMTFSNVKDSSTCKKCSKCEVGKKVERVCNITHDVLCGDCTHGFYNDAETKNTIKCRECSYCCGDSLDIKVPECVLQGLPADRQCAYTNRAVTKCHPKSIKPSVIIMISVFSVIAFIAIVAIIAYIVYRNCFRSRNKYNPIEEDGSDSTCAMENVSVSKFGKENPSVKSTTKCIYFPKSGVGVLCDDQDVGKRILDEVSVEVSYGTHQCFPKIKDQEVFLSPVIKLHPQDLLLEQSVRLQLFHSAHVEGEEIQNWSMAVLKSNSIDGTPSHWTNLGHLKNINIEKGWVEFSENDLGSYIVVGTPGSDGELSKKRMCCAVFGEDEPRVNAPYSIKLYLIDDCEPSLKKLEKEENNKGCTMMASLRIFHPDIHPRSKINIHFENMSEGWTVTCDPLTIDSKAWLDSYKEMPKFEAIFEHEESFNRDFKCMFKLKLNDAPVVEIPVIKYFEQYRSEVLTGIQTEDSSSSSHVNHDSEPTFTAAQPTDIYENDIGKDLANAQKLLPEITDADDKADTAQNFEKPSFKAAQPTNSYEDDIGKNLAFAQKLQFPGVTDADDEFDTAPFKDGTNPVV